MKIEVSKFGNFLISRPAGRDAFLAARAYSIPQNISEPIELDFTHVGVLTPSWADEFVRGFQDAFGAARVQIIEGKNLSVKITFETLRASP